LVDLQLDAQNSYLFTYNTFIKILYRFRALACSSSVGLRRNCVYAASGIVTLLKVRCLKISVLKFAALLISENFIIINFHIQAMQQIIIQ